MTKRSTITARDVTEELAAIRARADRVAQGLTALQFNWQPDDGRAWSVGQCFDHIARANAVYLTAVNEAIAAAQPRPGESAEAAKTDWLGRWFASAMEPPVTRRFRTTASAQPASGLDLAETRRRFLTSLEDIEQCAERAWRVDLDRTRFRNPFVRGLRLFNVASALCILLSHTRRHLWQAEQVKVAPGFPSL